MNANTRLASDIAGLIKTALLSRRGFMSASAAAAAGYTLAAGPVRAEAIQTDTSGIDTGDAKIKVSGGEMPVYFARPAGVQNPPIILVAMEIFGLHEYIRDVTRRVAKLGAFAVAPDYYFRMGDLTRITEINKLMPLVNSTRNLFRTLMPPWNGQVRKVATKPGWALWASAEVAGQSGNIVPLTPELRLASHSMARSQIRPRRSRSGLRAPCSSRPK